MVGGFDVASAHAPWGDLSAVEDMVNAEIEVVGIICNHRAAPHFGVCLLHVALFFKHIQGIATHGVVEVATYYGVFSTEFIYQPCQSLRL